jgi:hypothetical protein
VPTRMDEYFVHQTERPIAEIASDCPDWEEYLYFNIHDRNGAFCAIVGLDVLPNAQYVRSYLLTLHRGKHYAYWYAGPLENWREDLRGGSLSFTIVDPLKTWHLELADEANGIQASLDFHMRCPAYQYRHMRCEDQGQAVLNQSYYTQAGVYGGAFRLGEQVFTDLWGLRSRRWGEAILVRMPFYHWLSIQLPTRCITAWQYESAAAEVLYCDGAVIEESGQIVPITHIEHQWTLAPGRRYPSHTRLAVSTADGQVLQVECRPHGSHFLTPAAGCWSESDSEALANADASAFSVEQFCEFTVGQERGIGILNLITTPGYKPYGIPPLVL